MVSKTELEIIEIFHNKNMEQDTAIGFMCMLRQSGCCEQMYNWLKKNIVHLLTKFKKKYLGCMMKIINN